MKNLKLNIDRIIKSIDNEVTVDSLKSAIEKFESTYTFVKDHSDAEQRFKDCQLEGYVYERENQRFYTTDFEILIREYYVDPGSVDYVYSVDAWERE
jgi:hypothetical protein